MKSSAEKHTFLLHSEGMSVPFDCYHVSALSIRFYHYGRVVAYYSLHGEHADFIQHELNVLRVRSYDNAR